MLVSLASFRSVNMRSVTAFVFTSLPLQAFKFTSNLFAISSSASNMFITAFSSWPVSQIPRMHNKISNTLFGSGISADVNWLSISGKYRMCFNLSTSAALVPSKQNAATSFRCADFALNSSTFSELFKSSISLIILHGSSYEVVTNATMYLKCDSTFVSRNWAPDVCAMCLYMFFRCCSVKLKKVSADMFSNLFSSTNCLRASGAATSVSVICVSISGSKE